MALEYFLYTTLYNNTLVDRSNGSFTPLPPDTGEIQIDFLIPRTQPLYLYRESGDTIILNDDATINAYLGDTATSPDGDTALTYSPFTGYTATTKDNFDNFTGTTLPTNYYNKTQINSYSASTQADINTRVYRSGDTMTGTLCTTSNLLANGAVTGSSLTASVLMTTPVLNASTSISAPQITGSTCITSPISCATTRMQAPVVCGGTCVCSPIVSAASCVCAPTVCATTLMQSPAICGQSYVNSPIISGITSYAGSCLCSLGTTWLNGATIAASTLNVSGDTTIATNLLVGTSISEAGTTLETKYLQVVNFDTYSGATQTEIDGKIPKITGATAGNITLANADGTIYDSGISIDNITGGTGFYYYIENDVSLTNGTATDVSFISGTSGVLQAGTWSIDFSAAGGQNNPNKDIVVGFYVDGVLRGVEYVINSNDAGNRFPFALSEDQTLTEGTHIFEIRFRAGGGTAVVDYGSIRARLVQ